MQADRYLLYLFPLPVGPLPFILPSPPLSSPLLSSPTFPSSLSAFLPAPPGSDIRRDEDDVREHGATCVSVAECSSAHPPWLTAPPPPLHPLHPHPQFSALGYADAKIERISSYEVNPELSKVLCFEACNRSEYNLVCFAYSHSTVTV